jgi:hypothetical protein
MGGAKKKEGSTKVHCQPSNSRYSCKRSLPEDRKSGQAVSEMGASPMGFGSWKGIGQNWGILVAGLMQPGGSAHVILGSFPPIFIGEVDSERMYQKHCCKALMSLHCCI